MSRDNRKEMEDRKRKGKRAMTREEIEEEEREAEKRSRLDEMLTMIHSVKSTDLSKIISNLLPKQMMEDKNEFNWGYPSTYGITLWEKYKVPTLSTGLFSPKINKPSNIHNPIPKPRSQGTDPHCIPYAVFHLLTFQAYIISKYKKKRFFKLSLSYILNKFESLREKTVTKLGELLIKDGISRDCDFRNGLQENAEPLFSLTWHLGFSAEDLSQSELAEKICEVVKHYGGVLIEKYETKADGGLITDITDGVRAPLGHLLFCYGAKKISEGNYEFYCLDSAVKGGFAIVQDIHRFHHVYLFQLNDWSLD